MCSSQEHSLQSKLLQLECHFTWDLEEGDTDRAGLEDRLQEEIQFPLRKYKGSAYNHLAYVKQLQGVNEEALKYLEQAEEITRKDHEDEFEKLVIVTYGNFAWVYYNMGELTKAQSYLEKLEDICKRLPKDLPPAVYGEKGWTFLRVWDKNCDKSKECFEKALELEPDEKEWNYGYANVLYCQRRAGTAEDSDALKQLRRAQKLDPENTVIMVLLGIKLQQYKQEEEAVKLVEQALKNSPDNPQVIGYAAKYFRKTESFDKALELLTKGLEQSPRSGLLHHQIAQCYKYKLFKLQGKTDCQTKIQKKELAELCIPHLEIVAKQKPTYIYPQMDLAVMYAESDHFQKGDDLFQNLFRIPDIQPEELQALHRYYGNFIFNFKNSKLEAIKHYKEGFKIRNPSVEREKCYSKLNTLAEKRIKNNPHDIEALGMLVFIHKEKMMEFYEKALQLDPGNKEYQNVLSDMHHSSE
ncbi:Interferon-induced protein with tetratricopeptide repeats 1 [Acipenser ruthenus]|uniref:Interferon-induced protein with tetratricopeptide repeats 1 n=1 Tax=Acipenser ruthenus TaxID=7906 RepID=A0A444UAG6_ACIRT|nr:Interferon-induced protein with tetratricopeptide repeats 1 [Acipenser ruthenus]